MLLHPLLQNNLDIVGDIHGELDALTNLVHHLGYDSNGYHPKNRKLIFIGDLVDRGPDSYGVVMFVKNILEHNNGQMVLGNHELNLLQHNAKSGAGWYFDKQKHKDVDYSPFKKVNQTEREEIYHFLSKQPIALENENLRVVHAAWIQEKIEAIKNIPLGQAGKSYIEFEKNINEFIKSSGLLDRYYAEQEEWEMELEDYYSEIPFLENTCQYNLIHQMRNPIRVLTSGIEVRAEKKFYASGKWRFVQRQNWWDFYENKKPVIVGHYWRKYNSELTHNDENIFKEIPENSWHGKLQNVYCVDYSVGARFLERKHKVSVGTYGKLASISFPEKKITFDDGFSTETT